LLAERERSVQELAAALDLKEPTVSHHLAILRAQGVVTARAEGTTRWHALDRTVLERLSRRLPEAEWKPGGEA
jgi:DNA-binding transcriptional ArsR family regulator